MLIESKTFLKNEIKKKKKEIILKTNFKIK